MFDGPISESVPSGSVSFIHRRPRRDSSVSFHYLHEDNVSSHEDVITNAPDDLESDEDGDFGMFPGGDYSTPTDPLLEDQSLERYPSAHSRFSPERGYQSTSTSGFGRTITQKLYIDTEDLTAAITGFKTNTLGLILSYVFYILSFGTVYLAFHWFPSWWVALVGYQVPLCECDWVVIEVGSASCYIIQTDTKTLISIFFSE